MFLKNSVECFKQFRAEGCLPELILKVHNGHLGQYLISPAQIMKKLILEGGIEILQYCSRDEIMMMLNCSYVTAQTLALILMTEIMECSSLPLFNYIKYRNDVSSTKCYLRINNDPMKPCTVVFVQKEYFVVYPLENEVISEVPIYKIGLKNCFLYLEAASNALSFMLPGACPVTLQFEK